MKNVFLLMVVSALLVTLGFAQTPDAGSNTIVANVSGCLGGSDGAYTVTEDGTRQVFKITTSSVDLKPHVGHDVKLTGQGASVAASSGAADHSFAVAELRMISEHCAAAAAAAAGATAPYAETVVEPAAPPAAPSATASAPAPNAAAPAPTAGAPAVDATAPAAAVTMPAVEPAAPAAVVSPVPPTVSTPPVEAAAPAATGTPSPAAVKTPVAKAARPAPAAHARKRSVAEAAASAAIAPTEPSSATPTPEPAASANADATTAVAAVNPSPETVTVPTASSPDAIAPVAPVTHRAGSLSLLIAFVVLVIVLGTTAPLIGRWRKRKILERDGSPNLSFTNDSCGNEVRAGESSTSREKTEPRKVA